MRTTGHTAFAAGIVLAFVAHAALAAGVPPLVSVVQARSNRAGEPNVAGVGDRVVLTVRNLRALLTQPADCRRLTLVIDDLPLQGVQGESCDLANETVTFQLNRPESADRAWHVLLRGGSIERAVEVSLAGPSGEVVRSAVAGFELELVARSRLRLFAILALVGWLALIATAVRAPALRVRSRRSGAPAPRDASRWQLIWWCAIVATTYAYVRFVTGDAEPVDGANTAILISVATALFVWARDRSRSHETERATTRGFLKDIISESGEVTVTSLQFVVWNLVLGVLLMATAYRRMSVPHLSAQLLGLQGLSAAIYIVFKDLGLRRR